MSEWKKIKNYDVKVDENGKVENIVINKEEIKGINRVPGAAYRYDKKQNCNLKVEDLTFEQLKQGIYSKRYEIY